MTQDQTDMPRGRRGGRTGKQSRRAADIAQAPFDQPVNPFKPVQIVSDDELESIHNASLEVLETIGIDVLNDQAREIMKTAGADVVEGRDRVHFDRNLIESCIAHCPQSFKLYARNPAHNLHIGNDRLTYSIVASPPNASDVDGGRRPGNRKDFRNLLKLLQVHNIVHCSGGYPVEPVDLHPSVRHLDCIEDIIRLTDKAFHIYSLGRERNLDGLEMVRIARGVTKEQMVNEPSVFTVINTNSPLKLDVPMLQGVIEMAAAGQVCMITPFTLSGAMAPVTIAGAVVQQNAEALATMALSQMVRKGAPVIYGGFTSNVDMKSGAPAFGTPEYMKAQLLSGQLCRRYKVPFRSSNVCAANTVDAQSAYESTFSLMGCLMSGANVVKHAAGWLEGGLTASFEKFMLDIELLQMMTEFTRPLDLSTDALALDAMKEVGPGGHFFGAMHTQSRYKSAFYGPIISDWRNFETWSEDGSPTSIEHANRLWKERLEAYKMPDLAPEISEELEAFVAKRKEAGGVSTDF